MRRATNRDMLLLATLQYMKIDLYTITLGWLILSSRSQCAKEKKSHATNTRFLQCHFYLTRVVAADQGFFLFSLFVTYIYMGLLSIVAELFLFEAKNFFFQINVISYASLSDILMSTVPFLPLLCCCC